MISVVMKGFAASGSLIVAIGAQNAFVIRQGLMQRHLFVTALLCSMIDAMLTLLGILGFGELIEHYPVLIDWTRYIAILFLITYGCLSLKSAFSSKKLEESHGPESSIKKTIFMILVFSLLNPHVYLDTVILLGSIASQHPLYERLFFAIGAIAASFTWFFSLTYGTKRLAPLLSNPFAWKVIDTLVALIMWGIALLLFYR